MTAVFTAEGVFVFPTDRLGAVSSTTGTLGATAVPSTLAQFTAIAALSGVQAAAPTAAFTAVGELLIPTSQAIGLLEGEGQLAATAVPTALAQFTATAGLSSTTYGTAAAPFTAAGALAASVVASSTAPFSGAGTVAAAATAFTESGMNKSGTTQAITNAMAQITGFTADTTGYPGSTISGSALVVNGSGTGKTLTARVQWVPGSGNNHTVSARIMKNGTLVGTAGTPVTTSPSVVTVTTDVASGDLITVQVLDTGPWANSSFKANVSTGTGTYVRSLN
ncbi:hypothetical protein [Nocardia sp. NPDC060249]|uniref:hypothetical protein n=1 Tax=Nocardia sp. NPDC060249 TaxID=3347082 RepID=UPI00364A0CDE